MNTHPSKAITGLLALVALLLGANLVVGLVRPHAAASAIMPSAQAGEVMRLDTDIIITTNQGGDVLYIWQLGRYVGSGFENVDVRSYRAPK